jgi:hypothetical protein
MKEGLAYQASQIAIQQGLVIRSCPENHLVFGFF